MVCTILLSDVYSSNKWRGIHWSPFELTSESQNTNDQLCISWLCSESCMLRLKPSWLPRGGWLQYKFSSMLTDGTWAKIKMRFLIQLFCFPTFLSLSFSSNVSFPSINPWVEKINMHSTNEWDVDVYIWMWHFHILISMIYRKCAYSLSKHKHENKQQWHILLSLNNKLCYLQISADFHLPMTLSLHVIVICASSAYVQ